MGFFNQNWNIALGVLAGGALMYSISAQAACPDAAAIAAHVEDLKAARENTGFASVTSLEDGRCARDKLVKLLPPVLGNVVGYKAAFVNPAMYERFGVKGPEWGTMFAKYMVESGASMPAKFGAKPFNEADFIAVVKDSGLAEASTPLQALQHIEAFAPFIELPDLMLGGDKGRIGAQVIAVNVGFRGGALGPRVKLEPTQASVDALANMDVIMTEENSGKELGRVKGNVLMGNPLNAAMWIAKELKKAGITLKAGDLLSLGGFIPPTPTQPHTAITVKYIGLPGDPSVTVHLE